MSGHIRVHFIYGQFGKNPMVLGFIRLKDRLQELGYDVTDDVIWKYPDEIIRRIHETPKGIKTVLIGHSLGANCAAWVASAGQPIDLIVGYDPSAGFWPFAAALPNPIGDNVKRCICFTHVNPEWVQPAPYKGKATIMKTPSSHLGMVSDEALHKITLKAIEDLKEK